MKGLMTMRKANFVNTMPSYFGSYILSHSKRLMNDVNKQPGGFYNNSIYHIDADYLYIRKKHWCNLVNNGLIDKSLGLGKKDYGVFSAWRLAPKRKYCLVIDEFDVISAKRTFKGYSEEHRLIKLNKFI